MELHLLWISSERQLKEMVGSLCQVYVVLQTFVICSWILEQFGGVHATCRIIAKSFVDGANHLKELWVGVEAALSRWTSASPTSHV